MCSSDVRASMALAVQAIASASVQLAYGIFGEKADAHVSTAAGWRAPCSEGPESVKGITWT